MGDHGPTPCRRPKERVDVPVDQVLQAQVVQKTVKIQLIDRASRERPFSVHTETDSDRGKPTNRVVDVSSVTPEQFRSS